MSKPDQAPNHNQSPVQSPIVAVRTQTETEAALVTWFDEQRLKSVDNIESAAKQIITLTTTLLTMLLGLIAITGESLPKHMNWSGIQWLAGCGIAALFIALATALTALYPVKLTVAINDPNAREKAFGRILGRKSRALLISLITFAIGMLTIALIVIFSLTEIY